MGEKNTLTELADRIRKERDENLTKEEITLRQEYTHAMIRLLDAFTKEFKTTIYLLLENDITYSAHRHHANIPSFGSYIKFERKGKTLRMDVLEIITKNKEETLTDIFWRYADTGPNADNRSIEMYKKHKMNDFIVWLDENLING